MIQPRELEDLLELNRLRAVYTTPERNRLEAYFDRKFGSSSRLAVYGTLAPGRPNDHVLAPLGGQWVSGLATRGDLITAGWGADQGFPALRWSLEGPNLPVELLISAELPRQWDQLDRFEGGEYQRILVPLYNGDAVATIANIYVLAE